MPDAGLTDGAADFDAAFYESYVRKQVIAQLTTGTLPAAATEGRLFADTTLNLLKVDTGAALVDFGGWSIQSYTPTWAGVSGGTATGMYMRMGPIVVATAKYDMGSVSGNVTFTLPVNTAADYQAALVASSAQLVDTGVGTFPGAVTLASASTANVWAVNASGTYQTLSTLSSTVPITWATADFIYAGVVYIVA